MRERRPPAVRLLTVEEAAALLRTTPKALYNRVARGTIPGVIRDGRRLLFNEGDLLEYLGKNRAPSLV